MNTMSLTYTGQLLTTSCWCGINFAIPETLYSWMQQSPKNHCHCPMGHEMVFTNSLEERLKKAQHQLNATRDLLAHEERSHAATKGNLTKAKKKIARVEAGVCPECNRTFQNLARHMQTKHSHD